HFFCSLTLNLIFLARFGKPAGAAASRAKANETVPYNLYRSRFLCRCAFMRLRRLCLAIFAFLRFLSEPIQILVTAIRLNHLIHRSASVVADSAIWFLVTARLLPSFYPARRCRFSSKMVRRIVYGPGIFRSTHSHRANRRARKFRGVISFQPVYRGTRPLPFQKRLPCRRQSRPPRHSHSNRHRSRSDDQSRRRTLCLDQSAKRLFPGSGSISPRNRMAFLQDVDRAGQDRVKRTRTGGDKAHRHLPASRR